MTIDIEQLINEVDEDLSGKIEYGEFNTLLN
jgi:Ca2+-binding EF-hand superfamily protein